MKLLISTTNSLITMYRANAKCAPHLHTLTNQSCAGNSKPPPIFFFLNNNCFWQSNVGIVQVYIHFMSQNALTCSIVCGLTNDLLMFGQKCWCRGHASCLEMKNPAALYLLHLPPKERTQQKENWQHKETGLITLHSKILYVPHSSPGTAKYSMSLVIHSAQQNTLCA